MALGMLWAELDGGRNDAWCTLVEQTFGVRLKFSERGLGVSPAVTDGALGVRLACSGRERDGHRESA